MHLNMDMLDSLVTTAVRVCEEAQNHDLPRDLGEQIMYLSVCLQRLKEESEDLTPERWAEFLAEMAKLDTFIV
jgi:hypothetical protein